MRFYPAPGLIFTEHMGELFFFPIFKDSHFLKIVNAFNQRKCSLSLPLPVLLFKNYVPVIMNVRESVAKEA